VGQTSHNRANAAPHNGATAALKLHSHCFHACGIAHRTRAAIATPIHGLQLSRSHTCTLHTLLAPMCPTHWRTHTAEHGPEPRHRCPQSPQPWLHQPLPSWRTLSEVSMRYSSSMPDSGSAPSRTGCANSCEEGGASTRGGTGVHQRRHRRHRRALEACIRGDTGVHQRRHRRASEGEIKATRWQQRAPAGGTKTPRRQQHASAGKQKPRVGSSTHSGKISHEIATACIRGENKPLDGDSARQRGNRLTWM